MPKLYLITIRWNDLTTPPIPIDKLQAALSSYGEWLRFNHTSWFLWTDRSASQIRALVQPICAGEDSIFIGVIEPREYQGFAPKWVWDWMYTRIGHPNQN